MTNKAYWQADSERLARTLLERTQPARTEEEVPAATSHADPETVRPSTDLSLISQSGGLTHAE
jgi:hypothetical protein